MQEATFEGKKIKIIPLSEVPPPQRSSRAKWLTLFQQIPPGKAIRLNREDIAVTPENVLNVLRIYKAKGLLSDDYHATTRIINDEKCVYIENRRKSRKRE